MPATQSPKPSGRRARKSIAHLPSSGSTDKENKTLQSLGLKDLDEAGSKGKTRSKSLGPGGLEALGESSGNRQKVATLIIKSILKPTIPISPPKQIPPHNKPATPSAPEVAEPPQPHTGTPGSQSKQDLTKTTNGETSDPSLSEQQEQAAARETEKKNILERRDARRKSMANRRVSFAPEATLHTWDIVELPEDATSSSEATNSTRRASSGSTLGSTSFAQDRPDALSSDPPSTPPKAEIQVAASPAHQRDLHQKKRRRSSAGPPMNINDPELLSSSPVGSVSSDGIEQSPNTTDTIDVSETDSDEDKDTVKEGTMTGNINEDLTGHSEASIHSDQSSNTSSSTRLENSLRQAAHHAGAYHAQPNETGDVSMEIEENDAKVPMIQQAVATPFGRTLSSMQDQENANPFSPAFAAEIHKPALEEDDSDMTMEMTQAVGAIVQPNSTSGSPSKRGRRKSLPSSRRRSSAGRRRSSGGSTMADETMEFATAYGGIHQPQRAEVDVTGSDDEDEEMTMELTTVMGGVVQPSTSPYGGCEKNVLEDSPFLADDIGMDMDMTTAVGRLLSPVTERTEPSEDGTMGMDITKAIGSILPDELKTNDKRTAKMLMEEEADHGQLTRSPFLRSNSQTPKTAASLQKAVKSTDTGSPEAIKAQTPKTRAKTAPKPSSTPIKVPGTPSKQLTPQPTRPTTPSKTPPSKNVAMRRNSPKKLFKAEIKKAASKSPKASTPSLKFSKDVKTGQAIPNIVLTPPARRRTSGIGIDQDGLGSPRVAAILDRRSSILDSSEKFSPQKPRSVGFKFEDPIIMEQELDQERAEDERRESGRGILQQESEGTHDDTNDNTSNLKEMIQGLTPKKSKFKGRKSLAGSAKGVLGKRPVELDDEEDEEDATPKRLRGKERSPVKSILLPGPLSKEETIGRLGKAPKFALGSISGNVTTPVTEFPPPKLASTPKEHERFKDAEVVKTGSTPPTSFNEQLSGAPSDVGSEEEAPISLQDFLNMTNIRFMDLTTTKRRHTVMPTKEARSEESADDISQLADCVTTGASTIPMLDLFQHSCRELKKYISEGRNVVREIEKDTFEDNPPLFREYMSAAPDVRLIMDNQFKNVKAHARGESKRTWYEWRSKLFDGLTTGLLSIRSSMIDDDKLLSKQEEILQANVPELVERHTTVKAEAETLQARADEIADCDQDELHAARSQLVATEEEIEAKKKLIAELQAQLQQKDSGIEHIKERTAECRAEIQEAQRVASENKGWAYAEVKALKDKVDSLETLTGWTLHTCQPPHITYTYAKTLFLFAAPNHTTSPVSLSPNLPISLSYNPPDSLYRTTSTNEPPIIHRFINQLLQARLPALPHTDPPPPMSSILALISTGWTLATLLSAETARVRTAFATDEKIVSDDTIMIQSMRLLRAPSGVRRAQTKILVQFFVRVLGVGTEIGWDVDVQTKLVYGEGLSEGKMRGVVLQGIQGEEGKGGKVGVGGWLEAMEGLRGGLERREGKGKGKWKESVHV